MGYVPPLLEVLQGTTMDDRRPASSQRMKKSMKHGNDKKRRRRFSARRNNVIGPSRLSVTIARRVRTLKALIPNGESMGLEGLFVETADYIMCLETRVRMLQMVVDALTGCSDH